MYREDIRGSTVSYTHLVSLCREFESFMYISAAAYCEEIVSGYMHICVKKLCRCPVNAKNSSFFINQDKSLVHFFYNCVKLVFSSVQFRGLSFKLFLLAVDTVQKRV